MKQGVEGAGQRRLEEIRHEAWLRDFRRFQEDVHATGGFGLGETKEEMMRNLRKIRQEIFEEEYVHLYSAGSVEGNEIGTVDRG